MSNTIIIGIDDIEQCKSICDKLLKNGAPIAIDAEGLYLSATGRLTLLQVATNEGQVYLFDVVDPDNLQDTTRGKQLMIDGHLKDVLESQHLTKIAHSCFHDSAALFHQFQIKLTNVFDTQCAHLTLERSQGVKFPVKLTLADLISKYGTKSHDTKDFKDVWLSTKDYWLQRPLSQEAITYASEDVVVLHQLYGVMSRLIDTSSAWNLYEEYLDLQLNDGIEVKRVYEAVKERNLTAAKEVLQCLDPRIIARDFSHDQERSFLEFRTHPASFSSFPNIQLLKTKEYEFSLYQLAVFQNELDAGEIKKFSYNHSYTKTLAKLKSHENAEVRRNATTLLKEAKKAVMKRYLPDIKLKLQQGTVRGLKDLISEEVEAIEIYRQYKQDDEFKAYGTGAIDRLENELCRSELDECEGWYNSDQLTNNTTPVLMGKLRNMTRHEDTTIKTRAAAMFEKVKIAEMRRVFQEMGAQAGHFHRLQDLSGQQKKALGTLREFRTKIDVSIIPAFILQLEGQLSREELVEWEKWFRNNELKDKAKGFERAVIRTLTRHPEEDIAMRAKVLSDVLNPHRGRGGRSGYSKRGRYN